MNKILYEDNHILVVVKKENIPVQEDNSKDLDLLTILKQYIKEKYSKPGNVYLGLVHRLDRPVSGIMVFAKTSKAARRLSEQIKNNQMKKRYYAIVENYPAEEATLEDKLLKDGKTNIVKVNPNGKTCLLSYKLIKYDKTSNLSLVDINLITGRSHQIRVQFSSRNFSLFGDQKYNKNSKVGQQIALVAYHLEFVHPTTNKLMIFEEKVPDKYPWTIFK